MIFVPGSGCPRPATEPPASRTADPAIWVPPMTASAIKVFVPNHRATPALFPIPIPFTISSARSFVRPIAARFKVDSGRLGGIVGSSVGHLIALTGLRTSGRRRQRRSGRSASQRTRSLVLSAADLSRSRWCTVGALRDPRHTEKSQGLGALYQKLRRSVCDRDDPPRFSWPRRPIHVRTGTP